jgi:magnesium chelatase family protein
MRYRSKISGPLLDRIDIHIEVPAVGLRDISTRQNAESSQQIRARVNDARKIQQDRLAAVGLHGNSQMDQRAIQKYCQLESEGERFLNRIIEKLGFSMRAYARILKVARTIADLARAELIATEHLAEAVQYRSLDRAVKK